MCTFGQAPDEFSRFSGMYLNLTYFDERPLPGWINPERSSNVGITKIKTQPIPNSRLHRANLAYLNGMLAVDRGKHFNSDLARLFWRRRRRRNATQKAIQMRSIGDI